MKLYYSQAKKLVDTAIELAQKKDVLISVAVTDTHGEMLAFARMDGASLQTGTAATAKAYTAARELNSSAAVGQWARDTGKDFGYWPDKKMTGMGGGLPIYSDNECIGAMAISGLSEADDEALVEQALTAVLA